MRSPCSTHAHPGAGPGLSCMALTRALSAMSRAVRHPVVSMSQDGGAMGYILYSKSPARVRTFVLRISAMGLTIMAQPQEPGRALSPFWRVLRDPCSYALNGTLFVPCPPRPTPVASRVTPRTTVDTRTHHRHTYAFRPIHFQYAFTLLRPRLRAMHPHRPPPTLLLEHHQSAQFGCAPAQDTVTPRG